MRLFLDANVLVSVLNKEYPLFTYSSRILSLTGHRGYSVFTSPLCLAIAFYFAEKKNKKTARQKINLLSENLLITTVGEQTVKQTAANPGIHDFEDGLEYFSAIDSQCDCIITEDAGDFYFSAIEVLGCEAFFSKYLVSNK